MGIIAAQIARNRQRWLKALAEGVYSAPACPGCGAPQRDPRTGEPHIDRYAVDATGRVRAHCNRCDHWWG